MRASGGGDGNRVWLEWRAFCCLKKRCFLLVSYVNVHWIPDETGQVKGRRLAHQQSVEEMWAYFCHKRIISEKKQRASCQLIIYRTYFDHYCTAKTTIAQPAP
jgi:hypothetical protein